MASLQKEKIFAQEVDVLKLDKVTRTRMATVAASNGCVYVHEAVYDKLLAHPTQGLLHFPNGKHADVNDAFVIAINRLYKTPEIASKKEPDPPRRDIIQHYNAERRTRWGR